MTPIPESTSTNPSMGSSTRAALVTGMVNSQPLVQQRRRPGLSHVLLLNPPLSRVLLLNPPLSLALFPTTPSHPTLPALVLNLPGLAGLSPPLPLLPVRGRQQPLRLAALPFPPLLLRLAVLPSPLL